MKVFFIFVLSANGKISRSQGSKIDWNSKEDLEWFKEKTMSAGVMVMGRKTFEGIGRVLPGRLSVVMTRDTSKYRDGQNVVHTDEPPERILRTLEGLGYASAAVIGGREIFTLFLKSGLVDEIYATYEPVFIDGIDLFKNISNDVKLEVLDIRQLGSGAFVVHYQIKNSGEISHE